MEDAVFRYAFPVLGAIFSFYYAFRILVLKDKRAVKSTSYRITIDEEGYMQSTGYIFEIFGLLLLVYAYLTGWNPIYAMVVLVAGIIGVFIAFNALSKKHGAEPIERKKK